MTKMMMDQRKRVSRMMVKRGLLVKKDMIVGLSEETEPGHYFSCLFASLYANTTEELGG